MGFFFFFVHSNVTVRYINRRGFRMVSLEGRPRVEYGIKMIFLIFFFKQGVTEIENFDNCGEKSVVFIQFFRIFSPIFHQFF